MHADLEFCSNLIKMSRKDFPIQPPIQWTNSIYSFESKVISDQSAASESNRHLMDGSLPRSLQHIISNCEYYGASLFLLATDVVTVYVFQEPSLLSPLQDKGLTDVVLHALLTKEVSDLLDLFFFEDHYY